MKHPRSDLIIAWAEGTIVQWRFNDNKEWEDFKPYPAPCPSFCMTYEYRIKPKTLRFRNYLNKDGFVGAFTPSKSGLRDDELEKRSYFVKWIGDWQEVEIE